MFDIAIAGCGIVGLATAYQLLQQRPHLRLLILEKETAPALHQTGRNSGVVHSGVYYKPGSLKAKNCIEGRTELLAFCDAHNIPYRQKHKLIVATEPAELPRLHEIYARGKANGVPHLKLLSPPEIAEIEPHVNALQALFIPQCHIINYAQVAKTLCALVQSQGAQVVFNEPILEAQHSTLITKNRTYLSRFFINCTGLHSDRIAHSPQKIIPFRGEYYELTRKDLIQGLIYPVPNPKFPFLGVHVTPRLDGTFEAGPNAVLALAREGYQKTDFQWSDVKDFLTYKGFWKMSVRNLKTGTYEILRSLNKRLFLRDLRRLVPTLEESDLCPAGAGIRAQVVTQEGKLLDDFAFLQEPHALHVLNAPSPAATASLAIGRTIATKVAACTF